MILKIFSQKKIAKKLTFLIITLVFEKNANFLCRKLAKIAENCDHNIDPRWWVPISYTTLSAGFENTKNQLWLPPTSDETTVALDVDADQPVYVNVQETGFYRFGLSIELCLKVQRPVFNSTSLPLGVKFTPWVELGPQG
jgi:hypothetical protein